MENSLDGILVGAEKHSKKRFSQCWMVKNFNFFPTFSNFFRSSLF